MVCWGCGVSCITLFLPSDGRPSRDHMWLGGAEGLNVTLCTKQQLQFIESAGTCCPMTDLLSCCPCCHCRWWSADICKKLLWLASIVPQGDELVSCATQILPVILAVIASVTLYVVNYPSCLHACFTVTSSACQSGIQENIRQVGFQSDRWCSGHLASVMSATPQILSAIDDLNILLIGQFIVNCVITLTHIAVTIITLLKWMCPHSVWVLKSSVNPM